MLICIARSAVSAPAIAPQTSVSLRGDVAHPTELSGLAFHGDLLIACPDEGAELNVFRRADDAYGLLAKVSLLEDAGDEIDMEAAASDGEHLYVVGSHSMRRKKVDDASAYKKNRKRLTRVRPHDESYRLFRLAVNGAGVLESNESLSLANLLADDEILGPYAAIPGKENGVDVEGLAVKDGRLYVGFRGPVLRGNFVPVLSFAFDDPDDYELKFVPLAGRGIRDLLAVDDGLLLLAGPIGDGDATYKLYHWNGEDCVPGDVESPGVLTELGELPGNQAVKPEGLAILAETADSWKLLVVSDGDADASTWLVQKPGHPPPR